MIYLIILTFILLILTAVFMFFSINTLWDNQTLLEKRIELLQSQIDDDGWIYLDIELDEEGK